MKCTKCQGDGKIQHLESRRFVRSLPCNRCGGRGTVPDAENFIGAIRRAAGQPTYTAAQCLEWVERLASR